MQTRLDSRSLFKSLGRPSNRAPPQINLAEKKPEHERYAAVRKRCVWNAATPLMASAAAVGGCINYSSFRQEEAERSWKWQLDLMMNVMLVDGSQRDIGHVFVEETALLSCVTCI